jgi:hypothetical protein
MEAVMLLCNVTSHDISDDSGSVQECQSYKRSLFQILNRNFQKIRLSSFQCYVQNLSIKIVTSESLSS